jgi:hypothetical protein
MLLVVDITGDQETEGFKDLMSIKAKGQDISIQALKA